MTERKILNWEPIQEFWRNNSGVNWDELETAIKEALAFPQRTWEKPWVSLTDDELNMIGDRMRTWNSHSLADVYIAIEAKLKEKNT